jgi:hypothetical protein
MIRGRAGPAQSAVSVGSDKEDGVGMGQGS